MQPYYAPDFEVKIQGLTMSADVKCAVIALSYDNNLDQADMFNITLNNSDFRFTDSALFDVGQDVEIHLGYVDHLKPKMLGEIVALQPSFPEGGAPTITISGYDRSHQMRHNHKTRSFMFSNASLIAAQIAAENLLIPVVDPALIPFETKTQNGSDMTLLNELARRNFFETYVHWDKLYFRLPRPQTEAVFLQYGKNLSSFSPRLSTSGQVSLVALHDYDQKLAQSVIGLVPVVATDFNLDRIIERLGRAFIDKLTEFGSHCVAEETVNSFPDAAAFAKAIMEDILDGLFEGSGSCIGIPALKAGDMIDIDGVGKRFSGKYRLRRVTHSIDSSGYRTEFEVTQRSGATMLQLFRKVFEDHPSPHKQKKMHAPVVATVINNVDPEGLGRVQVSYPWLCGLVISAWARVVQADVGTYFIPDLKTQVLVNFEKGDFDRPIITGTFWNAMETPPEPPNPANPRKVIQSRLGNKIVLDDTLGAGGITLQTDVGAKLQITDMGDIQIQAAEGKKVQLTAAGNTIGLGPEGITITSVANGEITMGADGIQLQQANATVTVDTGGNISIVGTQIDLN